MTTTSNMSLTYIYSGDEQYTWATTWNSNFTIIDEHDHSLGKGVTVPLSAIKIISDFSFPSYLSNVYYTTFYNNSTFTNAFTSNVYVISGELYFDDDNGRATQITSGGTLNYTTITGGGFTGFYSTLGAECYYSATGDYYFYDDATSLQLIQADVVCTTYTDTTYATDYIESTGSCTVYCDASNLSWNFPTTGNSVSIEVVDDTLVCVANSSSYLVQTDGGTELYDALRYKTSSCSRQYAYSIVLNALGYYIQDINYNTGSGASYFQTYPVFYSTTESLSNQYNVNVPIGIDVGLDVSYCSSSLMSVLLPTVADGVIPMFCNQINLNSSITSADTVFTTEVGAFYVPCTLTRKTLFYDCFALLGQH